MNKRVRLFICVYLVLFILFFGSKNSRADFVSGERVDTNITLIAGYLSLDVKASQEELSFSDGASSQKLTLNIKNTGSLDGKITFAIKAITINNQRMTIDEAKQYIDLPNLEKIEKISAGETKMASLNLKRKKSWSDQTPIKITIQTTISQFNLKNDTSGFIDSKETTIILSDQSSHGDWPENLSFNQSGYAVGQQMYYSVVDNKYTTVVPGTIFVQYKNSQIISLNEQNQIETKLESAIHSVQSGNFTYHLVSIEYIEGKGFRLQLGLENSVVEGSFIVAGIQFNYIDNHLTYNQFNDFCKPLILESDVNRNNSYINNPLYSSSIGTNYQIFSNEQTNTFSYGLTTAEIASYVIGNFDVEFTGADANEFDVSFSSNSMIRVKQIHDEGGKRARLIFKDKDTKQIVFSREVISVAQDDFSGVDLSTLNNDLQTLIIKKDVQQLQNAFELSIDLYMKIPEDFLSHYYLQPFDNSHMKEFNVSYSKKMDVMKISFDYSYIDEPDTIEQMVVFLGYQFGFGFKSSENSYTLYRRTDYGSSHINYSTSSLQKQQVNTVDSTSESNADVENTNESLQMYTEESSEKNIDSEDDTDADVSEAITETQSEFSITESSESTEPTTNQTGTSQEP